MQYHANQSKEFRSFRSGWAFAKLYYSGSPNLSEQQLSDIVSSLRIAEWKYDPPSYRLGFDIGYRACVERSGNMLPLTKEKLSVEKETTMSTLKKVQENTTQSGNFVKASFLADIGAQCCLLDVHERDGNFGKEWILELLVDPSIVADFESGDANDARVVVSFAQGKNGLNSRDRVLKSVMGDLPMHNVGFEPIKMKSGQPYIDFKSYDGICMCGHDEDDGSTTNMHPF